MSDLSAAGSVHPVDEVEAQKRRNLEWWLDHKKKCNAVPGHWYLVDNQVCLGEAQSKSALLGFMMFTGIRPSPSYCIFQCGSEALPCDGATVVERGAPGDQDWETRGLLKMLKELHREDFTVVSSHAELDTESRLLLRTLHEQTAPRWQHSEPEELPPLDQVEPVAVSELCERSQQDGSKEARQANRDVYAKLRPHLPHGTFIVIDGNILVFMGRSQSELAKWLADVEEQLSPNRYWTIVGHETIQGRLGPCL